MQPILDAAAHLADEIARTRGHLSALESALDGMKPLLSRMDPETVQKALGYAGVNGSRRLNPLDVEIVEMSPPSTAAGVGATQTSAPAAPAEGPAAAPAHALEHAATASAKVARKYTKKASATTTKPAKKASSTVRKALVRNAAQAAKLPATGTEFWLKCMGKRKHTVNEIVDRALEKLSLEADARPTLYNRLNAWLYPKVKSGELVSPGEKDGIKLYQVAG